MVTKIISIKLLLATWEAGVNNVLFPVDLVTQLNPQKIIDTQGDNFPAIRESRRAEIDSFIEDLISSDTPELLAEKLRKTDQLTVSLYFDRIQAATFALESSNEEQVEVSESWYDVTLSLLQQKFFQSYSS